MNRKTHADRRTEITTNTTTRIRRVAAGAVLGGAALALIALGTATASHAADDAASVAIAPQSSASATTAPTSPSGQGTVALPPGGPVAIYPQAQSIGGANPYTPFGTNPYVPYGAWTP